VVPCSSLFHQYYLLFYSLIFSDDWILEKGLAGPFFTSRFSPLANIPLVVADLDLPPVTTITKTSTVKDALDKMLNREFDQLPVVDDHRKMVGFVSLGHLESVLRDGAHLNDAVDRWMYQWTSDPAHSSIQATGQKKRKYVPITLETSLHDLQRFFEKNSVAFVTDVDCRWALGVCTKCDLMKFLTKFKPRSLEQ